MRYKGYGTPLSFQKEFNQMISRSVFSNRYLRIAFTLTMVLLLTSYGGPFAQESKPNQDIEAALAKISANSLRGHLSFIASDMLEGRDTPSRGLDIAAEYIAAQFRRAGLEPVGDDGYFQTANWLVAARDADLFELKLSDGSQTINLAANQVSVTSDATMNLGSAGLYKIDFKDSTALAGLTADSIQGKAIITELPDVRGADRARRGEEHNADDHQVPDDEQRQFSRL